MKAPVLPICTARGIGPQHGFVRHRQATRSLGAIANRAAAAGVSCLGTLDNSPVDYRITGENRRPGETRNQAYYGRYRGLLSGVKTPFVLQVAHETSCVGHIHDDTPHAKMSASAEERAASLAQQPRVLQALSLFSEQDILRPLIPEHIHLVPTCSSVFENDHYHNIKHPEVEAACQEVTNKLASTRVTLSPDQMRAFEELPASTQALIDELIELCMESEELLRIAMANDYDWLFACWACGVQLMILLGGSGLGFDDSTIIIIDSVMRAMGFTDPLQAIIYKAIVVGDYTPDEDQPKTPFTHEQLLSRILELLERGFSVQGVLDVAQCTDYMDEQAILYSLVSELLIPSHMRAPCLAEYEVTEADLEVFRAHGLFGAVNGLSQMEAATKAHWEGMRYLEANIDVSGNGLIFNSGISLRPGNAPTEPMPELPRPALIQALHDAGLDDAEALQANHAYHTLLALGKALPVSQISYIVSGKDKPNYSWDQMIAKWQTKLLPDRQFFFEYISVPSREIWGNPAMGIVAVKEEYLAAFKQEQEAFKTAKLQGLANDLATAAKKHFAQTGSSTVVGVHAATLAGINYIRYIIPAREGYLFKTPDPGQQSVVFADMLKRNGVFPFQAPFKHNSTTNSRICWESQGWWLATSAAAGTACGQNQQQLYDAFVASADGQLQVMADGVIEQVAEGPCSVSTLLPRQQLTARTLQAKTRTLLEMGTKSMLPELYTLFEMVSKKGDRYLMLANSLSAANTYLATHGHAPIERGVGVLSGLSAAETAAADAAAAAAAAGPSSSTGGRVTRRRARAEAAASAAVQPDQPASGGGGGGGVAAAAGHDGGEDEEDEEDEPPRKSHKIVYDYAALGHELMVHLDSLDDKACAAVEALAAVGIHTDSKRGNPQYYVRSMRAALEKEGADCFVFNKGSNNSRFVVGLSQGACDVVSERLKQTFSKRSYL